MLVKKKCPTNSVKTMLDNHVKLVERILFNALETLECYLNNDIETAKAHARMVDSLETEADAVCRRITTCLHGGTFLPILRKDFFLLASSLDDVANAAEHFCDFCLSQRPEIPDYLCGGFLEISSVTIEMFPNLKKALQILNSTGFGWSTDETSPLHRITKEIGVDESNIDDLEWKLTRKIFKSDLPLARMMHIQALLAKICKVSDLIEEVSDRIEIMIARVAI